MMPRNAVYNRTTERQLRIEEEINLESNERRLELIKKYRSGKIKTKIDLDILFDIEDFILEMELHTLHAEERIVVQVNLPIIPN